MQTFLPYPDLRASCVVLDDRRLGKQRVETFQILRALTWPQYAWKNHPAVRMWRGFVPALVVYGLQNCREWTRRGYVDTVAPQLLAWSGGEEPVGPPLPPWFGLAALHLSHRSALLRKDPEWYGPLFAALGEQDLPGDLPYLWPPDVFPRWPVRGGLRAQPLPVALELLGLTTARPGQAEAAEAVADGRDALLVARPGSGGSTAALLAGLATAGQTVWVSPHSGPRTGRVPDVPPPAPRPVQTVAAEPAGPGEGGQTAGIAARGVPLARPPAAADVAAMQAESAPGEFVFLAPDALPDAATPASTGLVVVDRADELSDAEAVAVQALRAAAGCPPLLVVVRRADPDARAALVGRFGLCAPRYAGGGWDPGGVLEAAAVRTASASRRVLHDLVVDGGPAVVVTPGRARAERLVAGLERAGRRAALWAPPPLRASRAASALVSWRSRRLDALVVADDPPHLGRARVRLLVALDPPSLDHWRDLVEQVRADRAVLLAGPGAPPQVAGFAAAGGDVRARLLDHFGEPVEPGAGAGRSDPKA